MSQVEYYISHALFMASRNAVYALVSKAASEGATGEQIECALYSTSFIASMLVNL